MSKGGRPTRQAQDTTKAAPRGTAVGRAVRKLPIVGTVVKGLDAVKGDTTYSGSKPKARKISRGYGE